MPINVVRSEKLSGVKYAIRGPILEESMRMEARGEEI